MQDEMIRAQAGFYSSGPKLTPNLNGVSLFSIRVGNLIPRFWSG